MKTRDESLEKTTGQRDESLGKPRDWELIYIGENQFKFYGDENAVYKEVIHVVEASAFLALQSKLAELKDELEKTKHALRLTGEGRPSEWAYTQLLNDFKKAQAELAEALTAFRASQGEK